MDRQVPESAVQGVERGLVTTALVWQPLWFLAQPTLWPTAQPTVASAAALWSVGLAWLVLLGTHLLGRRLTWAVRLSVLTLAVAAAAVNLAQLALPSPDLARVSELAGLAAGVAGLLLSTRWAILWVVAFAVPLVWDALLRPSGESSFPVLAAYVLAIGLSAAGVRRALLRNAAAADAAAEALFTAERQARAVEHVEKSLKNSERRLHEIVLNTLVALGRGGLTTGEANARIRSRCVESVRMLDSLSGRRGDAEPDEISGDLAADVEAVCEQLRENGVVVTWVGGSLAELPRETYIAMHSAVTEALLNVVRHADAQHVIVRASVSRRGLSKDALVVVEDDGKGFDRARVDSRFGITEAIRSPMDDVGGTAAIESVPGRGTTVVLQWRPPDRQPSSAGVPPAAVSVPLLASVGLYLATVVVTTWSTVLQPGVMALAILVFGGISSGVIIWTLRARLTWPAILVIGAGGWVTYSLQVLAAGPETTPEWASSGVAVLFMVAAATGPRWAWLALVGAWLVIQGNLLYELTQPGTAMIVVGALLGRSTRRNAALVADRRQDRLAASAARDATQMRLERLGERYAALSLSRAAELLNEVADGTRSPADPDVRAWSVREERFIRAVVGIDPGEDRVHGLADVLAQVAYRRGLLLESDLSAPADAEIVIPASFVESCVWAVSQAVPTMIVDGQPVGTTARFSSRREGEDIVMRLLLPLPSDVPWSSDHPYGDLVDPTDPAGVVYLLEASVHTDLGVGMVRS